LSEAKLVTKLHYPNKLKSENEKLKTEPFLVLSFQFLVFPKVF